MGAGERHYAGQHEQRHDAGPARYPQTVCCDAVQVSQFEVKGRGPMSARVKLPPPLDKLLRSQLERAIYESALNQDDELIAKRRIIDKWGQMDVAAELGWYRSTVSDHEKYIFQRVEEVAKQLYTNKGAGD